ncbi:MAG: hypothetical protein ACTSXD_08360 [Candidatus Heimdallarchaeaceae archaeon]
MEVTSFSPSSFSDVVEPRMRLTRKESASGKVYFEYSIRGETQEEIKDGMQEMEELIAFHKKTYSNE